MNPDPRTSHPSDAMARVFVDELARRGTRYVFASPGSRSAPVVRAFLDHPEIRLHVVLDERSAAFAALGAGKVSRGSAAVLSTSGTAAANFHPAVLEAHHSSTPLLVLTADRPPELRETGAGQTTDQMKLYGSAARWFFDLGVPQENALSESYFRSVAARAYGYSLQRKGPVHLNLPFRDPLTPPPDIRQGMQTETEESPAASTVVTIGSSVTTDEQLGKIVSLLSGSERPLLVAGSSGADPKVIDALASAAHWPLIAEITSGARSTRSINCYEAILRDPDFSRDHPPDLVLRIGDIGISRVLPEFLSGAAKQVTICDGWMWSDPHRSATEVVLADPTILCDQLSKVVSAPKSHAWFDAWAAAELSARGALEETLNGQGLTEPRVARELVRSMPPTGTIVVGSSMPVRDLEWFGGDPGDIGFVANRGVNGIDGLVSTATGVASASAGPVVAFTGDIGFVHDSNGLQAASAADVSLTIVVVNNDGGGIFSFLPHAEHPGFEELFGTPHGIDISSLAAAHGWEHRLVKEPADFEDAIRHSPQIARGIIEVVTNRTTNVDDHRHLWEAVSRSVK